MAIGAGTKWMDVSKALDKKGLAVIGGRNSAVGVAGLTLGGILLLLMSVLALSPASIASRTPKTPASSCTIPLFQN